MQYKLLLSAALLSLTSLAGAQSPSQWSAAISDVNNYLATLTTAPAYTSVQSVLSTAITGNALSEVEILFQNHNSISNIAFVPGNQLESAIDALPTDVQNYISSVANAEVSIFSKDGINEGGARPTGIMAMGAMAAAGAVGLAMM
ncbi:hypothetical protein MMC06_003565 [Schaereria dolodes]|nr:hypothetical protein [Schaereria dolodes]